MSDVAQQCIDDLREQLAAAKRGWQPIETAPVDGTCVLVRSIAGMTFIASVTPGWTTWRSVPGQYNIKPTHWMPLPAPPTA